MSVRGIGARFLVLASIVYVGCGPAVVIVGDEGGIAELDAGLVPVPESDDPLLELEVVPSMLSIDVWPFGTPHPSRGAFFGIP